jgi:hypothetical protein
MTRLNKTGVAFFAFLLCFSAIYAQNHGSKIYLKAGEFSLPQNEKTNISFNDISDWDQFEGNYYGLLKLETYPQEEDRKTMIEAGIEFLEYISNRTFLVSIHSGADLEIINRFHVLANSPFMNGYKNLIGNTPAPMLAQTNGGNVLVNLHPYRNIKISSIAQIISYEIREQKDHIGYLTIRCPESAIDSLLHLPFIQAIDWKYDAGHPENYTGRTSHRVNFLSPENSNGIDYTGVGINVMLQDDGKIGPHIDHEGRVEQFWEPDNGDHGDHVAGIINGAGNLNPLHEGQAKGSNLFVYKAAPEYQGFDSIANHYSSKNIVITSTSYSNGCNAGYTALARTMDEQVYDLESLVHVFSAGNSGTSNCGYGAGNTWGNITGGHKMGKNVITVSNLDANDNLATSSSRGPAHDGRIKPDISAKGSSVTSTLNDNTYGVKSGTSMSCPGVSGTLASLYEAFEDIHGTLPPSGLMKAIVLNTADDFGNQGPDFKFGWGRINARKAFNVIENSSFGNSTLNDGDSTQFTVIVPSGTSKARFMLYWTDPEASISASTALINDLDLKVTDPDVIDHFPYVLDATPNATTLDYPAVSGQDHLNNMEQVEINSPVSGNYLITIKGFNVPIGPQKYYMVYWFEPEELVLTYPTGGESLLPSATEKIRWDSPYTSGNVTISYSVNGGTSWILANSSTPVSQGYFDWFTPNPSTGAVRIKIDYNSVSAISDSFSLIGSPTNLVFDYTCPDSIGLSWTSVNQASSYTIYRLGDKYMETIGTSATNAFVDFAANPNSQKLWYSVSANGPNNAKSKRMIAKKLEPGIVNCIVPDDGNLIAMTPLGGAVFTCHDDSLQPSFTIQNDGLNPISSFSASASNENGESITETFTASLAPNNQASFGFAQKLSLSNNAETVNLVIDVLNDGNAFNDTLKANYFPQNSQSIQAIWRENFESFELCSTESDCQLSECSLVNGLYNEQNGITDDVDWRVNQGSTPSNLTGPFEDHTLGTSSGKYLYLESSNCAQSIALLTSPCIDLQETTSPTLSFWYHLNGATMGSLFVDIFDGNEWFNGVSQTSGNQGNTWKNQVVNLSEFSGKTVNLRFRGIIGSDYQSDMAIDDIEIYHPPNSKFRLRCSK